MPKLTIRQFGPVSDAEIDLSRYVVLIGPQSSGKSTIAKLIYYFLHIRDEVARFVLESAEMPSRRDLEFRLQKRLRNQFVEFFGPTPQRMGVYLRFDYCPGRSIEVSLDREKHRFINLRFSPAIIEGVINLFEGAIPKLSKVPRKPSFISGAAKLAFDQERGAIAEQTRSQANELFAFAKELFFVPAGRSLLSTLSDQLQYIHPHQLDYPMRQFLDAVNSTKTLFNQSLDQIITARQALSEEKLWFAAIRKAQGYVRRVLKGEYRYDSEGGKIYVGQNVYTKISYASSGQQESVWILLSLFLLVLEKAKTLVVIEEPEAHLFPDAQKEVVEFIAFVFNEINCDFVITTHSPYVLASINNLLYAYDLGQRGSSDAVQRVVSRDRWLSPQLVSGYFVSDGTVNTLKSVDTPALRTELLDRASELINNEFDRLLEVERERGPVESRSGR